MEPNDERNIQRFSRSRSRSRNMSSRRGRNSRTPELHLHLMGANDEQHSQRRSRSRSRSRILTCHHERHLRTPERKSQRRSRIGCLVKNGERPRSRTRSRSHLRILRENEDELELQRQKLAAMESQLERERTSRRSEDNCKRSRDSPDNTRYDSASLFFDEFLKLLKNRPSELESFSSTMQNVIPEFDPLLKEQTIDVWLDKVDECTEIYGWSDRQTAHYALPKLVGQAKVWYQGLPSIKRTWVEWKQLLKDSFPSTENYAELLNEMLKKRARFGDSLELYYYAKVNLLNRCKIFGRNAVDCLVHGVDDRGVRVGAQAAKFNKPEDVLEFFKTVSNNSDGRDKRIINYNPLFEPKTDEPTSSTTVSKQTQPSNQLICFNCKQRGHPSFKCPKPLIKCTHCQLFGHEESDCRKKNSNTSANTSNTEAKGKF